MRACLIARLESRAADDATLELLSIPGFEASYARGMRDIKAGRTKPWRGIGRRKVRRDV